MAFTVHRHRCTSIHRPQTASLNVGGGQALTGGGRLTLGDGGTTVGTVNINTTGSLNSGQGLGLLVATNGGTGTINLDNGTMNTTQACFGGNNGASTGTLNMSGGAMNASGNVIFGRGGGSGTLTMTGGAVNGTQEIWFMEGLAANTGAATATIGAGAAVNAGSWLVVGRSGTNTTATVISMAAR